MKKSLLIVLALSGCLPPMKGGGGGYGGGGGGGGGGTAADLPYSSDSVYIWSDCGDSIEFATSNRRNDPDAGYAGMNPNTHTEVVRQSEGPTYIWLDSGASVEVSKETRVLMVDASCRTLTPSR